MSVHDLRRAIEPLKAMARDRAAARRRESAEPNPELIARLEAAVTAARSIEATLKEMAEEINGLFPYRTLAQGGWVVGISGLKIRPRPGRRPRVAYSRFEVVVSPSEDSHALELVCHRTVIDHDLDVLRLALPLAGWADELDAWLEAACLEFAESLFCARTDESWRPRRAIKTSLS